jgi:hypothetical protein
MRLPARLAPDASFLCVSRAQEGVTPLAMAAGAGDLEMMALLLGRGAKPNTTASVRRHGMPPPLHRTLKHSASPACTRDAQHGTALDAALLACNLPATELLLEAGATTVHNLAAAARAALHTGRREALVAAVTRAGVRLPHAQWATTDPAAMALLREVGAVPPLA